MRITTIWLYVCAVLLTVFMLGFSARNFLFYYLEKSVRESCKAEWKVNDCIVSYSAVPVVKDFDQLVKTGKAFEEK